MTIFTVRERSCGKVMFSQACVKCVSMGGGVHPLLGRHTLSWPDTPLGRRTPLLGRHPPGRHPPGRHPPDGIHPTGKHSCKTLADTSVRIPTKFRNVALPCQLDTFFKNLDFWLISLWRHKDQSGRT